MVLVSVIVLTYNHESYIREALQSILDQKVNFKYEVIVANDASIDGTYKIVQEFKNKYPDIFVIQQNENNVGILNNIIKIIPLIKGKYFAILDGDDFWSYELKLQKQIDFLEKNDEYNGVFHDSTILVEDDVAAEKLFFNKKLYSQYYFYQEEIHTSDLVKRLILPSSSALLRTNMDVLKNISILEDDFSVEWKLWCLLIKYSKFYYINEPWSVYRNHENGVSKSKNQEFHFSHIHFLKKLMRDKYFKNYKYDLYKSISNECSIILDSKSNKFTRKVFRKYLSAEVNRLRYYYIKIHETNKNNI